MQVVVRLLVFNVVFEILNFNLFFVFLEEMHIVTKVKIGAKRKKILEIGANSIPNAKVTFALIENVVPLGT